MAQLPSLATIIIWHQLPPQYGMRDHHFPRDMRALSPSTEHDQMAAFATLRLAVLQVSLSNLLQTRPVDVCMCMNT